MKNTSSASGFARLAALSLLMLHLTPSVARDKFVAQDIEVCPASANVLDPEFDSKSQLMTFMDGQTRVRVTTLQSDGTVGAAGCAGTMVDQGAWGWPDMAGGYNGPEWARSQRGLEIYFVKFLPDGVTPALARAYANGGGWQTEYLDSGARRSTILASTDETDPQARIMYLYRPVNGPFLSLWRETTDASTESLYPGAFTKNTGSSPRWIPGQRAISLTQADSAGVQQAARYFIDTQTTEILTSDAGNKAEVWMWSAPEFGGDLVFITVVDNCCLRVYRQTGATWNLINTINASSFSASTSIYSPEPRVVKGRSYVAMQLGNQLKDPGATIWIAAINPAAPLIRQISDPTTNGVRTEPEWFVTPQGAFVYYSQTSAKGVSLRRAATGAADAP